MTEETRIAQLTETLRGLVQLGGEGERTRIVTNLEVIDATGGAAGGSYIIIEDENGFYTPALKVPGTAYSNGDLVNVLYITGTEAIAFQQGSGSPETDPVTVSKLVSPDRTIDPVLSADNSGDVTLAGTGDLYVPDLIVHAGDADTYRAFTTNQMDDVAGGVTGLTVASTEVAINDGQQDVNFRVEGDNEENLIFTDAGNDLVGIGTNSPATELDVVGDTSTSGDFYPGGDEAGVFQRVPNSFQSGITTHFNTTFTGWTWASYTGFVTPGNIDTTVWPSHVRIGMTATEGQGRSFAYRSSYSSDIRCRLIPGQISVRGGLRMDDGTNDNYAEIWISVLNADNGIDGMVGLYTRYSIGGSVTGPTQKWNGTLYAVQYVKLIMTRSNDNVFVYANIDAAISALTATMTITGWTPARSGLYHEHQGTIYANARVTLFDWFYGNNE